MLLRWTLCIKRARSRSSRYNEDGAAHPPSFLLILHIKSGQNHVAQQPPGNTTLLQFFVRKSETFHFALPPPNFIGF
jgi:hypothetical protein